MQFTLRSNRPSGIIRMADHITQCRLAERALSERISPFNEADRFMYRFLSESIKFVESHAVAQMASVGGRR